MGKQIYQYGENPRPEVPYRDGNSLSPTEHNDIVRPRIARLLGKSLGWVEGESEHKRMRHLVSSSLS